MINKCCLYLIAASLFVSTQFVSVSVNAQETLENGTKAEVADPIEPINRAIHGFNNVLDKAILSPVAKGYRAVIPGFARTAIRSFLTNLTEPVTFLNSVAQGDVDNSFNSFWRFAINTTWGIGGIFDVADIQGLHHRSEDFGQTLGTYGVDDGFYLVLPIFGPSNARDAVGKVVDVFSDPFNYVADDETIIARNIVGAVDKREQFLDITDEIERTSFDTYASYRSLYTQSRDSEIQNKK